MDQHAVLNQLTTFHMHSHGSYTQANGRIVNFVTSTTSTSQYITSPLQRSYFGMMVPSTFPTRYPDLSVVDGPFSTLQPAGNPWFPLPTIADTSAATLSRLTRQPPSLGEQYPNYKWCTNGLPDRAKTRSLSHVGKHQQNACNHLIWTINLHVHLTG